MTFTATTQKLGSQGDGIAYEREKPVFIPKTCANERVTAHITRETSSAIYARLAEVITPAPQRRPAPCAHYAQCGGCQLQHLDEDTYRAFKRDTLESLAKKLSFPPEQLKLHFMPEASRRRVELSVQGKGQERQLAFYQDASHELISIKQCLILAPQLQAVLPPLQQAIAQLPSAVRIQKIMLTLADNGIDLQLQLKKSRPAEDFEILKNTLQPVVLRAGVHVAEGAVLTLWQTEVPIMQLGDQGVPLPKGAFLQASQQAQHILTTFVSDALAGSKQAADFFCGIGTYSLPLSQHAEVLAVDSDYAMIDALSQVATQHPRLRVMQRDLFTNPLQPDDLHMLDAAVINPPRAGAAAQLSEISKAKIKKLVMISCNPVSFQRDASFLISQGYRLEKFEGLDQFVYSPHLEVMALFSI